MNFVASPKTNLLTDFAGRAEKVLWYLIVAFDVLMVKLIECNEKETESHFLLATSYTQFSAPLGKIRICCAIDLWSLVWYSSWRREVGVFKNALYLLVHH